MKSRIVSMSFMAGLAMALQSCSAANDLQRRYNDRWGPDALVIPTDVMQVLERQHAVMMKIAEMSGYVPIDGNAATPQVVTIKPEGWSYIARFGMNYVDEKCDTYMKDLFILNREHERNDTILKKVDSVSAAIVGGALKAADAKIPLLAIGQAFGLIESVNDAASKSYLFEQIPGIVADKVKQARILYRSATENAPSIRDEASAYRAVRDYLTLCMPQTIEGNFLQTYIKADPQLVPAGAPTIPTVVEPLAAVPGHAATLNFRITQ